MTEISHDHDLRTRQTSRLPPQIQAPATSSIEEDRPSPSSAEKQELAVIGALRAAVLASGLQFDIGNSAEDLLVALLKQREPSLLSPDDGSADALEDVAIPKSRSGSKRMDFMSDDHSVVGKDIPDDPYLMSLVHGRKVPLACGSVRQDLRPDIPLPQTRVDKLASVSIGDVVTYEEQSVNGDKKHVMAAVVAIVSQRTRNNKFNLKLI